MNMNESHIILDRIKPDFNLEFIAARLRQWSACSEKTLLHLAREAEKIAQPKAVVKACRVRMLSEFDLTLNGILFSGQALGEKIAGTDTVYAYVATEGEELERWSRSYSGVKAVFARVVRYAALMLAEIEIVATLRAGFGLGPVAALKPGRQELWPLEQQAPLFELLSPLPEKIGVTLRPDFWMIPSVAASGLLFPTEITGYHC